MILLMNTITHIIAQLRWDLLKQNQTHILVLVFTKDNNKDRKFKDGDFVRISKYKNIFAKSYIPNSSEEVFVIRKNKNTVLWTYVINDLNGEKIVGTFY